MDSLTRFWQQTIKQFSIYSEGLCLYNLPQESILSQRCSQGFLFLCQHFPEQPRASCSCCVLYLDPPSRSLLFLACFFFCKTQLRYPWSYTCEHECGFFFLDFTPQQSVLRSRNYNFFSLLLKYRFRVTCILCGGQKRTYNELPRQKTGKEWSWFSPLISALSQGRGKAGSGAEIAEAHLRIFFQQVISKFLPPEHWLPARALEIKQSQSSHQARWPEHS